MYFLLHADVNIHASNCQIWYRHPNSEAGNDEIQNIQDEWGRVVALPRHKFVTGATLLQLDLDMLHIFAI
jgi:hypothetical protein